MPDCGCFRQARIPPGIRSGAHLSRSPWAGPHERLRAGPQCLSGAAERQSQNRGGGRRPPALPWRPACSGHDAGVSAQAQRRAALPEAAGPARHGRLSKAWHCPGHARGQTCSGSGPPPPGIAASWACSPSLHSGHLASPCWSGRQGLAWMATSLARRPCWGMLAMAGDAHV